MFTRNDGWGNEFVLSGITTKGFVDIFAWCDLEIYLEESVQFGPDIIDEEFQITLPHSLSVSKMFLTSAMVRYSVCFTCVSNIITGNNIPQTTISQLKKIIWPLFILLYKSNEII